MSNHPSVQRSMAVWHDMVARRDMRALPSLLHPEAVFRSPAAYSPYQGEAALVLILNTVLLEVFEDFTYHRELWSDDGLSVVLEFSAKVARRDLKGIDMIRFDANGKIVDFEVMVRPASGLRVLAEAMGTRIGERLESVTTTQVL